MKLASKFLYSLKQGIKGIFHSKTMSFISIISVTASLIILGIVLTIVLNINQFIDCLNLQSAAFSIVKKLGCIPYLESQLKSCDC